MPSCATCSVPTRGVATRVTSGPAASPRSSAPHLRNSGQCAACLRNANLRPVDRDDEVARLKTGDGRGAVRRDPGDAGDQNAAAVDAENPGKDHDGQDEIGDRTGRDNCGTLPYVLGKNVTARSLAGMAAISPFVTHGSARWRRHGTSHSRRAAGARSSANKFRSDRRRAEIAPGRSPAKRCRL